MNLTDKEKMLGFALHARGVKKEATLTILMLLSLEDEVDDMVWFINENPGATEAQLFAVAYQLDKESREKGLKN